MFGNTWRGRTSHYPLVYKAAETTESRNAWSGKPEQYSKIDKATEIVNSLLEVPVVRDAVGLGLAAKYFYLILTYKLVQIRNFAGCNLENILPTKTFTR